MQVPAFRAAEFGKYGETVRIGGNAIGSASF